MVAWAPLCLLVVSLNLCLRHNPHHRNPYTAKDLCERYSLQLKTLLSSLLDVIDSDKHLSSHPELGVILRDYLHNSEPNRVKGPNRLPILKQKFVDDSFVEEGSEDDFPPTNEVVAEIFRDLRLLFWRKDQRRVPVGRIEDILLTRLRPFIMFPIVKPCRKENVDNMLNFVRSAYLRYLETPCYDNAARTADDVDSDEDDKDRLLQIYIWHKRDDLRQSRPKPKSCQTRAFNYFLESIKIIVQLFIKNYDCHPEDDYNAPPVNGFDDETGYKIPTNYRQERYTPFRSPNDQKRDIGYKNHAMYNGLDKNTFGGDQISDTPPNPFSDNGKYLENAPYDFPSDRQKLNTVYGERIPLSKDSVLVSPFRDEVKLRNQANTVHLHDGGYGDMHSPFYHTPTQNRDQINASPLALDQDSSSQVIPNLVDYYRSIYGIGPNSPSNANPYGYLNDVPNNVNPANGQSDSIFNPNVVNPDPSIFDPANTVPENFKNGDQFAQFDTLINRPSIDLPSFDQASNKTDVEVVYVVRHPKVLVYNPQFVIKQKMSYGTYLQNLKEIFKPKHFSPDNDVQLLQVLRVAPSGEIIPLYQSKDQHQPLLVEKATLIKKLFKEVESEEPDTPLLRAEPEVASVPVTIKLDTDEAEDKSSNATLRVKVSRKITEKAEGDIEHGTESPKDYKVFVDETRSSKEGAKVLRMTSLKNVNTDKKALRMTSLKNINTEKKALRMTSLKNINPDKKALRMTSLKKVHSYGTPSYNNIVNSYINKNEGL